MFILAEYPYALYQSRSSSAACAMECGVAAYAPAPAPAAAPPPAPAQSILSPTERSPAKTGLHVNFSDKGEVKERREKFLTAKYGSHQMALIRKRLAVEMWLYDELQKLYESNKESTSGSAPQEVEVDVDELLDMDSDDLRRRHLTVSAHVETPRVRRLFDCLHSGITDIARGNAAVH
ncbi:Protein phosphatase 1 regulatory subunit 14B [Eumeta japonica]|uniref:Protein phosphatase 1 regulatory subunit 14B n=1 Tax=Eumeta variegata TaxID=151549 RepID=A0A4C1WU92_EUMVA|nr:Protein phosphatase 1 regulatory subunit 14B [Eumeta japonica]